MCSRKLLIYWFFFQLQIYVCPLTSMVKNDKTPPTIFNFCLSLLTCGKMTFSKVFPLVIYDCSTVQKWNRISFLVKWVYSRHAVYTFHAGKLSLTVAVRYVFHMGIPPLPCVHYILVWSRCCVQGRRLTSETGRGRFASSKQSHRNVGGPWISPPGNSLNCIYVLTYLCDGRCVWSIRGLVIWRRLFKMAANLHNLDNLK